MGKNGQVIIKFSEEQRQRLMRNIGISADGVMVDKSARKVTLLNPRAVASFRLSEEQRDIAKTALGQDFMGLLIDPATFGVDMVTADDARIQMWGEYRE